MHCSHWNFTPKRHIRFLYHFIIANQNGNRKFFQKEKIHYRFIVGLIFFCLPHSIYSHVSVLLLICCLTFNDRCFKRHTLCNIDDAHLFCFTCYFYGIFAPFAYLFYSFHTYIYSFNSQNRMQLEQTEMLYLCCSFSPCWKKKILWLLQCYNSNRK